MATPAHVVILGCGRSGTSIFGELFEDLGVHAYRSEPPFEDLPWLDWSTPRAVKVPRVPLDGVVTPGLSVPLDGLLSAVPEPRVLFWQVRHPLDAICSLRVGIGDGWSHHPRPPDWADWADRPLLDRCSHHWRFINGPGFDAVADQAVVHRFEDLIDDPRRDALEVCDRVGIDRSDPDVAARLGRFALRVQDTDNADFVEARTSRRLSRPDHSRRVGRWQENLDPADVARLVPDLAPIAARFGYRLPAI